MRTLRPRAVFRVALILGLLVATPTVANPQPEVTAETQDESPSASARQLIY
jgi:hypothetical protein